MRPIKKTTEKLCPHCGDVYPCFRETCREASSWTTNRLVDSRGLPVTTKRSQLECERVRKKPQFRLLPDAIERIRAAALREGIDMSDYVERWALSLPPVE
jgi:hypothetical protein